jgi:hypothetical protein
MAAGQIFTLVMLAIVAICYLVFLRVAWKARHEHKRKFPVEADIVEEERDL